MYTVELTVSGSDKFDVHVERQYLGGVFIFDGTVKNDPADIAKIIDDIKDAYAKWVEKDSPLGLVKAAIEAGLQ